MGNQDAPKAPAGWYPIEEGKPGERYWTGVRWSGKTRGVPETSTNPTPKGIAELPKYESLGVPRNKSSEINLKSLLTKTASLPFWWRLLFIVCASILLGLLGYWVRFFTYFFLVLVFVFFVWLGFATFTSKPSKPKSKILRIVVFLLVPFLVFGGLLAGGAVSYFGQAAYQEQQLQAEKAAAQKAADDQAAAEEAARVKAENEKLAAEQAAAAAAAQAAARKARVPEGFTDANNGLAYTFIDGTCGYISCAYVQIYAYQPCSSVYIEANTVDDSGLIYGMTNDLLGSMQKGDSAVATLHVIENGATAVKITKLECH